MDRLMIVKDMVMSEKKLLRLWPEYTIDLASHLVIPVVNITRHLRLFDSVVSYLETMLENRSWLVWWRNDYIDIYLIPPNITKVCIKCEEKQITGNLTCFKSFHRLAKKLSITDPL